MLRECTFFHIYTLSIKLDKIIINSFKNITLEGLIVSLAELLTAKFPKTAKTTNFAANTSPLATAI
jgi:hypothetical protein